MAGNLQKVGGGKASSPMNKVPAVGADAFGGVHPIVQMRGSVADACERKARPPTDTPPVFKNKAVPPVAKPKHSVAPNAKFPTTAVPQDEFLIPCVIASSTNSDKDVDGSLRDTIDRLRSCLDLCMYVSYACAHTL